MNRLFFLAPACVALLLAACAGTSLDVQRPFTPSATDRFAYEITPQANMSADALALFDARLKSRLVPARGAAGPATRNVDIAITRYVTRKPEGVELPADAITSRVTVRDATSGAVLGQFSVDSKNPGTWRTTAVLLNEHADRIAAYLRARS